MNLKLILSARSQTAPSPSAFGDLTGTSVPLRYLGQQGAISAGSSGARRARSKILDALILATPEGCGSTCWICATICAAIRSLTEPAARDSAQGLANAEEVALAVFEPRTLFTDSLAGIISCDFGDPICGLKTG
jgi:hypothetical protein